MPLENIFEKSGIWFIYYSSATGRILGNVQQVIGSGSRTGEWSHPNGDGVRRAHSGAFNIGIDEKIATRMVFSAPSLEIRIVDRNIRRSPPAEELVAVEVEGIFDIDAHLFNRHLELETSLAHQLDVFLSRCRDRYRCFE